MYSVQFDIVCLRYLGVVQRIIFYCTYKHFIQYHLFIIFQLLFIHSFNSKSYLYLEKSFHDAVSVFMHINIQKRHHFLVIQVCKCFIVTSYMAPVTSLCGHSSISNIWLTSTLLTLYNFYIHEERRKAKINDGGCDDVLWKTRKLLFHRQH